MISTAEEGISARREVFQLLCEYGRSGAFLDLLLSSRLSESLLDRRDRAFVTELAQGVVRRILTLDYVIRAFSSRDTDRIDPRILWLLRSAAYQLIYLSVPSYAAVNTAVEIAKREIGQGAASFVNGLLRGLLRGIDGLEWPEFDADPAGYLEIVESHPAWLVNTWIEELGEEDARSLCHANNIPPDLAIRCNLQRATRSEIAAEIESQGPTVEEGVLTGEALLLKGSGDVSLLPGFINGLYSVQDQGAMLVSRALSPEPGMRVIDICAAPGGKACHCAELMNDDGMVVAVDINEKRLEKVRENASRLGLRVVQPLSGDGRDLKRFESGSFDRVLVDAPCSGLGTLARRADARWRKKPDDLARLPGLQLELLEEGARLVAHGGRLVYSTCTISMAENEAVVRRFLAGPQGGHFQPVHVMNSDLPIQLRPDTHGCDGMYFATFELNC